MTLPSAVLDEIGKPVSPFDQEPGSIRFKRSSLTGEADDAETVRERLSEWTSTTVKSLDASKTSEMAFLSARRSRNAKRCAP